MNADADFYIPQGITTDGTNLYVADTYNHTIRKIVISTGEITIFAGTSESPDSTDGIGADARFNKPSGITTDGTNLYVADTYNHTIRKIVISTGEVSTIAGTAGSSDSTDGIGADAKFYGHSGITTNGTNLYVTDTYNDTIRKIVISTREVTTIAGTAGIEGSTDGIGADARFYIPYGITTDGINLYVADTYNYTIRKIVISTGEVTTLAGTAGSLGSINGTGAIARFWYTYCVTTDGTNLFVTDDSSIRKIVISTAEVSSLAGKVRNPGSTDGIGSEAKFYCPNDITTDGTNLYVADTYNHTIRKIEISTREVTTLAGKPGCPGSTDGIGTDARFNSPSCITTDGINLFVVVSNYSIRKIMISTGEVTTLAASIIVNPSSTDGISANYRVSYPTGITTDGNNLYVTYVFYTNFSTHSFSYQGIILKMVISTGEVTTLAGSAEITHHDSFSDGVGIAARFAQLSSITTDGSNLYVADLYHSFGVIFLFGYIRKIVISTGEVTTIAGSGWWGSTDGIGSAARFNTPNGITTDGTNLFLADTGNSKIRKIIISTGEVTSLAGSGGQGSTDGIGVAARFYDPVGITTDGISLYVTDTGNDTIRKIGNP